MWIKGEVTGVTSQSPLSLKVLKKRCTFNRRSFLVLTIFKLIPDAKKKTIPSKFQSLQKY